MCVRNKGSLKALFLHWGPGCNAEVERRWFGEQIGIDWWDQPKVSGPPAFAKLGDAALARLDELYRSAGHPIHLIAHSFGGTLAQHLAEKSPEKIAGITLLSCGVDPWMSYIRFARYLSSYKPELNEASQTATRTRRPEDLWKLIQLSMQVPNLQAHYWKNEKARSRYLQLSQGVESLDFSVFELTLNEFTGPFAQPKTISLPQGVRVRCFLGSGDPMVDAVEEAKAWERVFPQCESIIVPQAGHFVQFEADPSQWLEALTSSFRS